MDLIRNPMTTLTIEQAFWNIHYKVKYNHCYERAFLNTVGRISGIVMLGPAGFFAWDFLLCAVQHCYAHESLYEKMEKIGTSKSQIKKFIIKLSEDLGYKENWRKMYSDIDQGVFDLNETSIEPITK